MYQSATVFGKVSFELKCGARPNTIEATIDIPTAIPEGKAKLFVRAPFDKPIKNVMVNGKLWSKWDAIKEFIVLPAHEKTIHVIVNY